MVLVKGSWRRSTTRIHLYPNRRIFTSFHFFINFIAWYVTFSLSLYFCFLLFLFQFYFSFHFVLAFLTSIPGFPPTGTVTDPFSFFPSQNIVRYQYYVEKFGDENAEPVKWKVHVEHCFEYLRQAISCGGDLIIEGESPIRVGTGHATSVTGWGVEHDCINFNKLLEFQKLQEARYNQTWQNP